MPSSDYICTAASFGVVVHHREIFTKNSKQARDFCAADGAHLPTPKNAVENEWYSDELYFNYDSVSALYWLGITYEKLEGRGASL